MDGDNSFISYKWIEVILNELKALIDSKSKVTVISILGNQSSYKSTLLNFLFNQNFAVKALRCTKGIMLSFIKLNLSKT